MKKMIIMFFVLSLFSCDYLKETNQNAANSTYNKNNIVILEGCEYWFISGRITHKGNCKNPIHPENWSVNKFSYSNL
jgi:hypothetical protein